MTTLVASLALIAVASVLVAFALHKRGEPAKDANAGQSTSARHSVNSTPPASPAAHATATASATAAQLTASPALPAPTAPTSAAPPPTSPPPTSPPPTSQPQGTQAAELPALDVLNDSRITGLAAHAAAEFRAKGWTVATVGNFKGSPDVPATTVFYPDGDEAAARILADAFGVTRVLKAPSYLSDTRVTVVLARDWPERPAG